MGGGIERPGTLTSFVDTISYLILFGSVAYILIYNNIYIYIPRTSGACIILAPKGKRASCISGAIFFTGAEIIFSWVWPCWHPHNMFLWPYDKLI